MYIFTTFALRVRVASVHNKDNRQKRIIKKLALPSARKTLRKDIRTKKKRPRRMRDKNKPRNGTSIRQNRCSWRAELGRSCLVGDQKGDMVTRRKSLTNSRKDNAYG